MARWTKLAVLVAMLALALGAGVGCPDANTGNSNAKHCSDSDNPLWCPDAGVCCRAGYPIYCDARCYQSDPGGCQDKDTCKIE